MPYLKLEGVPLYYELRGPHESDQPLTLFFNGWCLSARYWQATTGLLEKDFQLLLLDSRGFGRSNRVDRGNLRSDIESSVAEAWKLLEKLSLGKRQFHVVGHSLGGVTAVRFAAQAQERGQLSSLTVVNSGSFEDSEPQGSQLNTFVKVFVRVKAAFDLPLVRSAVVRRSIALPVSPEYVRVITQDFALANNRLAEEQALDSLKPATLRRYRAELSACQAPLLLVVGNKDSTIPPGGMYNIKRFKPEANLVPFAESGHMPMLEEPGRFARTLADHFNHAQTISTQVS